MAASYMDHPLAVNRLLVGGANANQQARVCSLVSLVQLCPSIYFVMKILSEFVT